DAAGAGVVGAQQLAELAGQHDVGGRHPAVAGQVPDAQRSRRPPHVASEETGVVERLRTGTVWAGGCGAEGTRTFGTGGCLLRRPRPTLGPEVEAEAVGELVGHD